MVIDFIIGLITIIGGASLTAWLYGRIILRQRLITDVYCGDLLIFVAHQDDEAIAAGEYAIEAAKSNKHITIVYLTCGDQITGSARAELRKLEALSVWESLGVSPNNLHFIEVVPLHWTVWQRS